MLKKTNKKDKYEILVSLQKLATEMDYAYSQLAKIARSGALKTKIVDGIYYSTRKWVLEYLDERADGKLDKLPLNLKDYLLKHATYSKKSKLNEAVKNIKTEDDWSDPEDFLVQNWANTATIEIERQARAVEAEIAAMRTKLNNKKFAFLKYELGNFGFISNKAIKLPSRKNKTKGQRKLARKYHAVWNERFMVPWNQATTVVVWSVFSIILALSICVIAPDRAARFTAVVDRPFDLIASSIAAKSIPLGSQYRATSEISKKVLAEYIKDYSWFYKLQTGQIEGVYKVEAEEITGRVAGAFESVESTQE